MIRDRAVVYEPWARNEIHYEFIKCFLLMISQLYETVVFYGEFELVSRLRREELLSKISFNPIRVVNCSLIMDKIFGYYYELNNINRIKEISAETPIFITCGIPYTMYWCRKLLSKSKIYFVMHGGLEYISGNISPWKLYHQLKNELHKLCRNHRIIVLGDSIKNNLIHYIPKIENRIISIDHPYMKKEICSQPVSSNTDILKIGTIGVGTVNKGLADLKEIAVYLQNNKEKIQLSHVGKLDSNLLYLKQYITLPFETSNMIDRELFEKETNKLDYFLFLYPSTNYRLTASGAIFDALVQEKPIIAIKNDYFDYFFTKYPGIGYLFDNIDTLCENLSGLPKRSSTEYLHMVQNEKYVLSQVSPYIIKDKLLSQLI